MQPFTFLPGHMHLPSCTHPPYSELFELGNHQTLQSQMDSRAKLKITILGAAQTGKSAIAVRFLTRRYITEYSSQADLLYSRTLKLGPKLQIGMDILDTCTVNDSIQFQSSLEQISWANAYVVVYSINDQGSFLHARKLLEVISLMKGTAHLCPILVLANKADLSDSSRQVCAVRGQEVSAQYGSIFYEVSAAEGFFEITLAFQRLIHLSKPILKQQCSSYPQIVSKINSTLKMTKMFGQMLAKMSKKVHKKKKKKSLSI